MAQPPMILTFNDNIKVPCNWSEVDHEAIFLSLPDRPIRRACSESLLAVRTNLVLGVSSLEGRPKKQNLSLMEGLLDAN